MSKENVMFWFMIGAGIVSIVSLVLGLSGFSEKEKINKSSRYYISVNHLINGIMLAILFILSMFYVFDWIGSTNKASFFSLIEIGAIFTLFISGMYGVLNKKKINNPIFSRFSRQGVILSMILTVSLVAFWLRWRHL